MVVPSHACRTSPGDRAFFRCSTKLSDFVAPAHIRNFSVLCQPPPARLCRRVRHPCTANIFLKKRNRVGRRSHQRARKFLGKLTGPPAHMMQVGPRMSRASASRQNSASAGSGVNNSRVGTRHARTIKPKTDLSTCWALCPAWSPKKPQASQYIIYVAVRAPARP